MGEDQKNRKILEGAWIVPPPPFFGPWFPSPFSPKPMIASYLAGTGPMRFGMSSSPTQI